VYVAGPWKSGDDSADAAFFRVPVGLTDRVVGTEGIDMPAHVRDVTRSLPASMAGDGSLARYAGDEGKWESVVHHKYYDAVFRTAQFVAESVDGIPDDNPKLRRRALRAAVAAYTRMAEVGYTKAKEPTFWYNAGITAAHLDAIDGNGKAAEQMLDFWASAWADGKRSDDLRHFLTERLNPFTKKTFKGRFPRVEERVGGLSELG